MVCHKSLVWVSLTFILLMMLLVFSVDKPVSPTEDTEDTLPIDREAIYAASATLMGFATFGSILGVRMSGSSATEVYRFVGSVTMICGAVGVIFTQAWIMYYACCAVLSNEVMGLFMVGTAGTLATIVVGFAVIVEGRIKHQNGSSRD